MRPVEEGDDGVWARVEMKVCGKALEVSPGLPDGDASVVDVDGTREEFAKEKKEMFQHRRISDRGVLQDGV